MAGTPDDLAGLLMALLKDKRSVIEAVVENLQQVSTIKRGTEKLLDTLKERHQTPRAREIDHLEVALALTKSVNKLTQSTEQLLVFALLYVSEGSFDTYSALMMGKVGRGLEDLGQMWKNILNQ